MSYKENRQANFALSFLNALANIKIVLICKGSFTPLISEANFALSLCILRLELSLFFKNALA
jgi:hypothetical protein